jgi:hypothetical protein
MFDNVDDLVNTGNWNNLTGDLTVCFKIKLYGYGEGGNGLILSNGKIWIYTNVTGKNIRISGDGLSNVAVSVPNSIQLGVYYCICITRTLAGVANIYINNVLNGSANQNSGTPESGTTDIIIGNNITEDKTVNGQIFDLFVYSDIKDSNARDSIYSGTYPTSNLLGAWTFIEGDGTTIFDVSGNSNNGTVTNAILADFWVNKTNQNRYGQDYGYTINAGVNIPALLDGSTDAQGNPIGVPAPSKAPKILKNGTNILKND